MALSRLNLKAHGHHAGAGKAVALELACRLTGWTHRAIGAYDGGISSAAISVARRRLRESATVETSRIERLAAKLANKTTASRQS